MKSPLAELTAWLELHLPGRRKTYRLQNRYRESDTRTADRTRANNRLMGYIQSKKQKY